MTEQELLAKLGEWITPREWGQYFIELCRMKGVAYAPRMPGLPFIPFCREIGVNRGCARGRIELAMAYENMSPASKAAFDAKARPIITGLGRKRGSDVGVGFSYQDSGVTAGEAHKFRLLDAVKNSEPKRKGGPIPRIEKFKNEWLKMHPNQKRAFLQWLHQRGDLVELPTVRHTGAYR